jgi:hypothetical protein
LTFYNSENGKFQPVTAAHLIYKRFNVLIGLDNPNSTNIPLAIYRDEDGIVKAITATNIEKELQYLASVVYNINPKTELGQKQLHRWSSHSLCVGACTILHA